MTLLHSRQRGTSIVLVMVVLVVMLLGGLALSRTTEAGTLVAGNIASRSAAMQASEVGVNAAYAALKSLADEGTDRGTWYTSHLAPQTPAGLPDIDWDAAPSQAVGSFTVSHVVERVCDAAGAVTDPYRQCLLKEVEMPVDRSEDPGDRNRQLDNPYAPQFRLTARATDARNTTVFVQMLVTRGTE